MSLLKLAQTSKKNKLTHDTLTGAAKGAVSGVLGVGAVNVLLRDKIKNLTAKDYGKALLASTIAGAGTAVLKNVTKEKREKLIEYLRKSPE